MKRKLLITGANRGLGKVAFSAFPEYDVIAWTRAQGDYLVPSSRWDAVPYVECVLHCAGGGLGLRDPCPTTDELQRLFMVNLGGAAELNRLIIPYMKARGYGRIVHVCSIASGEAVGSVGYNTMKAALAAYVRSLGREMAPHGIVVSGISPGAFEAPDNAMHRLRHNAPQAYDEFLEKRLPRKVMGQANELIGLIRYLISDEASMMAGSIVPIDAGEGRAYA